MVTDKIHALFWVRQKGQKNRILSNHDLSWLVFRAEVSKHEMKSYIGLYYVLLDGISG